jgi:hypothetical protein
MALLLMINSLKDFYVHEICICLQNLDSTCHGNKRQASRLAVIITLHCIMT